MFISRAVNHKINRFHERGLRALLNDETSTFYDMLSKINDTAIHLKIILQIELNSTNISTFFGFHNERSFCKRNP